MCWESLKQRKSNKYKYILKQLNNCIPTNQNHIVIAYEPIWSIGSLVPTLNEINEIYSLTKLFLIKIKDFYFLYGGSVNSENLRKYWIIQMMELH